MPLKEVPLECSTKSGKKGARRIPFRWTFRAYFAHSFHSFHLTAFFSLQFLPLSFIFIGNLTGYCGAFEVTKMYRKTSVRSEWSNKLQWPPLNTHLAGHSKFFAVYSDHSHLSLTDDDDGGSYFPNQLQLNSALVRAPLHLVIIAQPTTTQRLCHPHLVNNWNASHLTPPSHHQHSATANRCV